MVLFFYWQMALRFNSKKSDAEYICDCAQQTHTLCMCAHIVQRVCGRLLHKECVECACDKIPSVWCAEICTNKKSQNIDIFETKTPECV